MFVIGLWFVVQVHIYLFQRIWCICRMFYQCRMPFKFFLCYWFSFVRVCFQIKKPPIRISCIFFLCLFVWVYIVYILCLRIKKTKRMCSTIYKLDYFIVELWRSVYASVRKKKKTAQHSWIDHNHNPTLSHVLQFIVCMRACTISYLFGHKFHLLWLILLMAESLTLWWREKN